MAPVTMADGMTLSLGRLLERLERGEERKTSGAKEM